MKNFKNNIFSLAVVWIFMAATAAYSYTHVSKEWQSKHLLDQIKVNPNVIRNSGKG